MTKKHFAQISAVDTNQVHEISRRLILLYKEYRCASGFMFTTTSPEFLKQLPAHIGYEFRFWLTKSKEFLWKCFDLSTTVLWAVVCLLALGLYIMNELVVAYNKKLSEFAGIIRCRHFNCEESIPPPKPLREYLYDHIYDRDSLTRIWMDYPSCLELLSRHVMSKALAFKCWRSDHTYKFPSKLRVRKESMKQWLVWMKLDK